MPPPPSVTYLKNENIMCYSAFPKPFFDEAKERVSKGDVQTAKIAGKAGGWDDALIQGGSMYMMRCGQKPAGSGFLVLDIDVHGTEMAEKEFFRLHTALRDTTGCIIRTPSGGLHYYYRIPEGMDWGVERKCESITIGGTEYDTSRAGEGRLDILSTGIGVILPGSTYTFDKKDYVYEYFKGTSLADASPVPAYLIQTFNNRPGMTLKAKRTLKSVPPPAGKTAPTPPTPPGGLGGLGGVFAALFGTA